MGAHNLQMPGRRRIAGSALSGEASRLSSEPLGFAYWNGISGRRYVHTIYSLLGCPALPEANYVLVHRDADGRASVLRMGRTSDEAATLNLAHIRRHGAELGATEVHVHMLARSDAERARIEFDLRSAFATDSQRERPARQIN